MAKIPRIPSLTVLAALLAGCAVGPDYKRPETSTPQAFRGADSQGARSVADLAWWDLFRDPALDSLIRAALSNGFDARIAAARVEQSRAISSEIHGERFPGVGYEGNADRGRNAVIGNPFAQNPPSTTSGFDGYLGAAWEFDLWGRVRRLDEAGRAQYLASEEARRGVLLSLVGNIAANYYDLLELDEELAIEKKAAQSFGESLRLFQQQLEGGSASRLDTASAEAAMEASQARIPALEMAVSAKENQISVLIGAVPGPIARGVPLASLAEAPDVPVGLPSDLLERRPDVRQAELSAQAANAGIGVTIGGFLPRIGLSAILGGVTSQLDQITTGKAGLWSVGANVTGPLFQGGSLHGQYEQAKAAWEEARLRYQQAALSAFADASNALISHQRLAELRGHQQRAVKDYEDAVGLSTERYKAGRASYFEVIDSQLKLFPAQVLLAQARRDQFKSVVQLYESLGGGWNVPAGDWSGTAR